MRIRFGTCSFIAPEGFEIQESSCLNGIDFSKSNNPQQGSGSVIVLVKKGTGFGNKTTYIYKKSDLNPNHYSPVLTLNSVLGEDTESPLEYLKKAKESFLTKLPEGNCCFCEIERIGHCPAARMQLELGDDLRLTYLGLVWQWEKILFHASVILPYVRTGEGWSALYTFSESVRWEGKRKKNFNFNSAVFSTSYEKRIPKAAKQFPITD